MTDTIPTTKRLSGIPPGRCIHQHRKDDAYVRSISTFACRRRRGFTGFGCADCSHTDQVYAMIETHQRAYDTWLVAEEAADIPEQKQPEARIVIKQFDRGELSASEKAADGSFF